MTFDFIRRDGTFTFEGTVKHCRDAAFISLLEIVVPFREVNVGEDNIRHFLNITLQDYVSLPLGSFTETAEHLQQSQEGTAALNSFDKDSVFASIAECSRMASFEITEEESGQTWSMRVNGSRRLYSTDLTLRFNREKSFYTISGEITRKMRFSSTETEFKMKVRDFYLTSTWDVKNFFKIVYQAYLDLPIGTPSLSHASSLTSALESLHLRISGLELLLVQ